MCEVIIRRKIVSHNKNLLVLLILAFGFVYTIYTYITSSNLIAIYNSLMLQAHLNVYFYQIGVFIYCRQELDSSAFPKLPKWCNKYLKMYYAFAFLNLRSTFICKQYIVIMHVITSQTNQPLCVLTIWNNNAAFPHLESTVKRQ